MFRMKGEGMIGKRKMLAAGIIGTVILSISGCGFWGDFDAQKYVKAYLDRSFKGEVKEEAKIVDTSEKELKNLYEEDMKAFVTNSIAGAEEIDDRLFEEYEDLCKEIFASAKYKVKEAEKVSGTEYKVEVEYESMDVFPKFISGLQEESDKLLEKVENGEYKGTEDEINDQLEKEFIANSLQILKASFENRTYAKPESVTLKITSNEDNLFSIDETESFDLVQKILQFGEIQD